MRRVHILGGLLTRHSRVCSQCLALIGGGALGAEQGPRASDHGSTRLPIVYPRLEGGSGLSPSGNVLRARLLGSQDTLIKRLIAPRRLYAVPTAMQR